MTEEPNRMGDNAPIFSVGELSGAVKRTIEGAFERVRVRGEISRPSFPSSGHCYFRLKDENAVLDAVVWRGVLGRLGLRPEDGLEVVATGRMTTFAGKSSYQLIVDRVEVAGEGALLKLLEERKRKLAAEGLFAAERKCRIPFLPRVVGVVTSPSGAVIRDILHRLEERFPRRVLVWPVAVQGEQAARQVAEAIAGFNALPLEGPVPRPDLLIVARGGGSLEDLWSFNEEIVVRAAAESRIPLISAVGHETDTTLIDFASDRRAPTPTAAAEMAVPVRADLMVQVHDLDRRLPGAVLRMAADRRNRLEGLARGLPEPRRIIEELAQRLDDRGERLRLALAGRLRHQAAEVATLGARLPHPRQQLRLAGERLDALDKRLGQSGRRPADRARQSFDDLDAERRLRTCALARAAEARSQVEGLGRLLESYSHQDVLRRGFALVRRDGHVVTRAAVLEAGDILELEFADGRRAVLTEEDGEKPPARSKTTTKEAKHKPQPVKQPRLL